MSLRKAAVPVPLLIDSFPVPPSYIPPTPTASSTNPPPSRPPSSPLPPVPGPSRISEADTLQLLLFSSRANRSRRSSKYSLAAPDSNRDSIISTSSTHSYHGVGYSASIRSTHSTTARPHHGSRPSPPSSNRTSTASSRSMPTSPITMNRPSIAFSIDEEDETRERMTSRFRDVVSPLLPLSYDDQDPVDISPRRRKRRHHANESISSIDVRDILGAISGGEEEEEVLPSKLESKQRLSQRELGLGLPHHSASARTASPTLSSSHSQKSSLAYLNFDGPPPFQPGHSRSLSAASHSGTPSLATQAGTPMSESSRDLASASTTTLRSTSLTNVPSTENDDLPSISMISSATTTSKDLPSYSPKPKTPTKPRSNTILSSLSTSEDVPSQSGPRAPSPDIDTIIQATPKPAKLSLARSASMTYSRQRTRVSSLRSMRSVRSLKNIHIATDEFGILPSPVRSSKGSLGKKPLPPTDPDDSLDYIVNGVWDHQGEVEEEDEKRLRMLEQELEGSGSESDDSSLDLHTPLPHLMVRHGLLSPNSKLLPQAGSRATTPQCGVDGRPGSTMSIFSTVTKSGVIKDQRDTPNRRVRHRDGRLLKGGIGLTTGLGWSDSEDEDAPSPLTKRLSTLDLSRRSSTSSFVSTSSVPRPHPLSRSYSSGTLYEDSAFGFGINGSPNEEDEDTILKDTSDWALRQRKTLGSSNPPTAWQRKMSGASASTRTSIASSGGRLSIASSGGRLSVASTGSAFSLEVTTPENGSRSPVRPRPARESASSGESPFINRRSGDDFGTPSSASTLSIPLPVTPQHDHQVPSHILNAGTKVYLDKDKSLPPLPGGGLRKIPSKTNLSKHAFPRARTFSSTSSSASTPLPATVPAAAAPSNVRPLQLPRQVRSTTAGDRPAVPVPSLTSNGSRTPGLSSPRISSQPSEFALPPSPVPSSVAPKPKPRTGTGMVYKSSRSSSTKMRPPMPLQSASLSTSAIGRPNGITKPLAF